jgi:hypothetical protein
VTSAESAVDKAEKVLTRRERGGDANATIASSQSALYNTETAYCPDGGVSFCGSHSAPISSADEDALVAVSNGADAARALAASKVLGANTSYVKAIADQQAADDAVDTARAALDDANDALERAEEGPTSADVASADAAVSSARVAVESAQEKLTDLQNGATQDELAAAQSDIDSAETTPLKRSGTAA